MPRGTPSKRIATCPEIEQELRDAGDFLGAAIKQEAAVATNSQRDGDPDAKAESERLFIRDFNNFLRTARTAREYLRVASDASKCAAWFKRRCDGDRDLFDFFRLLAAQSGHQYRPRLISKTNRIQYVGEPDSVLIPAPGGGLMPNKMRVTGLVNPTYAFTLDGLEPDTEEAYRKLAPRGETVVELSVRYLHALRQILKNAERNHRFASAESRNESQAS